MSVHGIIIVFVVLFGVSTLSSKEGSELHNKSGRIFALGLLLIAVDTLNKTPWGEN